MTLPVTPISLSQVNVELLQSATATISLNDTNVRALAGVPSGTIGMNNLQGKQYRVTPTQTYSSSTANASINVSSLSGYVAGISDITITINSGVTLSSASSTAGLTVTGGTTGDTITIVNRGTIYGGGGAGGVSYWKYGVSGNASPAAIGQGGSNAPDGWGTGMPGSGPLGQYGAGATGYTAISYTSGLTMYIYNYGTITGGGGGSGGMGINNDGGGAGGNGGIALTITGTPSITLYNQSGAIFGGGGGGGSGWGNRSAGATVGGTTGTNAVISVNGGGNFGALGVAGNVSTNNSAKLYSGVGTYSL